jgi:hypothetical protein
VRRRTLRWATLALALATVVAVAPPAAHASSPINNLHLNIYWHDYPDQPLPWRGSMQMVVYSDHRKDLLVCDQKVDPYKVIVEIDPTGGGPPDTLLYADENFANPGCGRYTFWYPVRKWRILLEHIGEGGGPVPRGWGVTPLPRPDF